MKIILFIGTALMFAGCTQVQFVSHSKTVGELRHDYAVCDYEAEKATIYFRSPFVGAMQHVKLRNRCMQAKGYTLQPA